MIVIKRTIRVEERQAVVHSHEPTAQHLSKVACVGRPSFSGGDIEKAIPDPIPNSEVKLLGANGTARATVWESRTLPG